jgi:16S rRNA (uracil1498-N3)-methyltransferase
MLQSLFGLGRLVLMRLHRFYVTQPLGEEVVVNSVSLISQWTKVFRYTSSDHVILFNGDGYEYEYVLTTISKTSATLTLVQQTHIIPSSKPLTLYLAVIKKDNFELAIEKATELGITSIVPFLTSRTEKKGLNMERLTKILIEASEQSGRVTVPSLHPIVTLQKACELLKKETNPLIFHTKGKERLPRGLTTSAYVIGPEGGFSQEEVDLFLASGCTPYLLGDTILRAETAVISACALLTIS